MGYTRERLFKIVEDIPAFPRSVQQVLTLSADINCSPKDLVDVIKHDPIFTLKILKVVNSPFIGLVNTVTSIHQAIVYLGLNTIKNIALSLATIGALPKQNEAGFDMNGFWLHSMAVATVSRQLAEILQYPRLEWEEFFSAGLLHDVGKVVFALYMPDEFRMALDASANNGARLFQEELEIIGTTHANIGAVLAKRWGLPEPLVLGISKHHRHDLDEMPALVDCVFAANQICKAKQYGFAGEYIIDDFPEAVVERFGMDRDELTAALPDLEAELEKAKVFIEA